MKHKLEVRLLGKFEVRRDGKPVTITSRPAQSLFAYLILSAETVHRREKLAGLFWPDSLEETARDNLRHALWRMRKALEAASSTRFLQADDVTISFRESSDYWLDAAELQKLSENATADERIAVLANYQGELLPGFYDEWVVLERDHLYSLFEHHMTRLLSRLQEEKRWLDVVDWGERWIKLGQKPEPAYRGLMAAHAARGDMSKVAATYERCVRSLRELGIEPSQQTKELFENLKLGKETPKVTSVSKKAVLKQNSSSGLPTGIVTFLFTDIEGSTKLAQAYSIKWENLRARHHTILRNAIASNNGFLFQIIGDAFCAAFHTAKEGFQAALDAQRKLQAENWGKPPIKVRMGLHTGAAEINGNDYLGYMTLVRVQRVMSVAHGGQILASNASAELLHGELGGQITLRDMKEHLLKDLPKAERLWQIVAPDLQQDFPPLQSLMAVQNNLPVPLTSFVGREKEVETILQLLGKSRMVTLTGAGGMGKTRLAIESSKQLLDQFKDGIWWIELAGLNDPSLAPQAVAKVLKVSETQNQPTIETLVENFQPKQLLLVLDNCEHLIMACAQLADQLLTGCQNLKILATSREALDILGEIEWRVPSLSLPDSQDDFSIHGLVESESIRLFTERARVRQPQFDLTYQNALAVLQICRRLDGIPLAIELAAARVKMMSVEEIARRLDSRFDLLMGGNRAAPPRHQTLRAAIDWSYELLTKPEQTLFRRLSVFLGGFDLDAAETICGFDELKRHVLTLLGRLVDKSLVFVEATSNSGPTRYRLLETIREYALEKLTESSEEPTVRDHHMEFFAQLAANAELKLLGAETFLWVLRLDADHDNLLAAIDWSLKSENTDFALQIVGALAQWDAWHNLEGAEYSLQVVESPRTRQRNPSRAKALNTAGVMQMFQGKLAQARLLSEEARALSKELGESESYLWALAHLGGICVYQGDNQAAQAYLEEALVVAGTTPRYSMGWVFAYLGDLYMFQGNREQAQRMYEESVARLRELNNRNFLALPLRRLAELALDNADYEKATALFKSSLELNAEGGDQRAVLACLAGFGAVATARGHAIAAVRLFGAVDFLLRTFSAGLLPIDEKIYERNMAILRSQLDETTFDVMWAEGSEMTMDEAIAFALEAA